MLEGTITRLDLDARTVVVRTGDGREVTATVSPNTIIEVSEPETMGTMGGDLEDLEEGYLVQLDVHDATEAHACACVSLVCLS